MYGLNNTNIIAYMLDSLVRVSRRVGRKTSKVPRPRTQQAPPEWCRSPCPGRRMRRTKPNDRFDMEQTRRRTRFASSRPNENFLSLPPQRFQVSLILFCSFKVLTEGNLYFFHLSFTLLVRYRSLIVI
jgi:hypothetical protein